MIVCKVGWVLVQETPDSGRPHKAVSPILLGEASIIQLALNVGQEEVRRDSPPMLWMMLTCQKTDDDDDDDNNGDDDQADDNELLSLQTRIQQWLMIHTHTEERLCVSAA